MYDFQNRIALVTGGANGIGLALVKALIKEGTKVVIADVNPAGAAVAQEFGADKVLFVKTDVTNSDEFESIFLTFFVRFYNLLFSDAFREAVQKFGGIDIVCNNAGIAREDQWETMIAINSVSYLNISGTDLTNLNYSNFKVFLC